MSISLERVGDRMTVRLETHHAHARLIPAISPGDDDSFHKTFMASLATWQAQGYAQEDAATLALFDVTARQKGTDLTDAGSFPSLIDINLPEKAQHHRQGNTTFAAMRDPNAGIYPIVDSLAMLEKLLDAGARIIQLRIKSEQLTPQIERTIAQAVKLTDAHPKAQLFINDYWQAAISHGAFGVHLGQEDLLVADLQAIEQAGLRLGVSSHAYWEVARAMTIAPSYIACGPVFPTRAKVMPWIAQGVDNLAYWTALIPHPVIAIGGIHADNLHQVRATGCACASVIQAIVAAPDPVAAFKKLQHHWNEIRVNKIPLPRLGGGLRIAAPTLAPDEKP